MTELDYTHRPRFAGSSVGCLLCPTYIQRKHPGTIRDGVIAHLYTLHPELDAAQRMQVANDALRGRPRRHDEQRTN